MQSRAAIRYAKALLDLSLEKGEIEKVYADMQLIHKICKDSKDLQLLLESPVVKTDKKQDILKAIFTDKVNKLTMSFLLILTAKKREGILKDVAASFIEKYYEHKNILRTVIRSVSGVSDTVKSKVKALVKATYNSEVEIVEEYDAKLIGGFILKVGDKQIDTSVKAKLEKLRRNFSDNPYIPEF
jgi:F-type H+-transporting ATPase subunit delta